MNFAADITKFVTNLLGLIIIIPSFVLALRTLITKTLTLITKTLSYYQVSRNKTLVLPHNISIEILQVKREKLDPKDWKREQRERRLKIIWSVIATVFWLTLLVFSKELSSNISNIFKALASSPNQVINNANLAAARTPWDTAIFLLFLYYYVSFPLRFFNYTLFSTYNAEQFRYRIFKKAEILLRSDLNQIFEYIQIVLVEMKAKGIEFDLSHKTIEADFGTKSRVRLIKFSLKPEPESQDTYSLEICYPGEAFDTHSSRIINQFIRLAVFSPKQQNQPAQQKRSWRDRLLRRD